MLSGSKGRLQLLKAEIIFVFRRHLHQAGAGAGLKGGKAGGRPQAKSIRYQDIGIRYQVSGYRYQDIGTR